MSRAHANDAHENAEARPAHLDHEDPVAEAFFRHPDKPVIDVWEDHPIIHTMSRGSRRAMFTSIGIFAVSMLGIGAYSAYHNWIMPAPVELAGSGPLEPTLPLAPEPAPIAQAQIAPSRVAPTQLAPAATSGEAVPSTERDEAEPASNRAAAVAAQAAAHDDASPLAAKPASVAAPPAAEKPGAAAPAPPQPPEPVAAVSGLPASATPGGDHMRPTYDELLAVGRSFSKKNRRTEAVEAFQRALIQSPEASTALSGLGYVYLNAAENRRAQEYAERAVEADASNAEGWIVLGAARELLGDKSGAMAAYRSCVERGKGAYLSQCRQVVR